MKLIFIRLFICTPLYILWFISALTIVTPWYYWVVTGEDYLDLKMRIHNLGV